MGQAKEFKCKECGNVWTHYMGFVLMKLRELLKNSYKL